MQCSCCDTVHLFGCEPKYTYMRLDAASDNVEDSIWPEVARGISTRMVQCFVMAERYDSGGGCFRFLDFRCYDGNILGFRQI